MKKINIPTVNPDSWYDVKIMASKCNPLDKSMKVHCKAQTWEGLRVFSKFEFYVPNGSWELPMSPNIHSIIKIKGWKINEMLRTLYLNDLRNGVTKNISTKPKK
jgi:hypothetical protein